MGCCGKRKPFKEALARKKHCSYDKLTSQERRFVKQLESEAHRNGRNINCENVIKEIIAQREEQKLLGNG